MVVRLQFGLWYPEANDCGACCAGLDHTNCPGVLLDGKRVYHSGIGPWGSSNMDAVTRAVYQ